MANSKQPKPTNSRNPTCNPVIQGILYVMDAGYGTMSGNGIYELLNTDHDLARDLAQRFNANDYRADRVSYVQCTIDMGLIEALSPGALKLYLFLAMHAAPGGFVSMRGDELGEAVGMERKATRMEYIRELKRAGVLIERDASRCHEPPVWQINPYYIHSGKRQNYRRHIADFESNMPMRRDDPAYIRNRHSDMVVRQDRVSRTLDDGSTLYYTWLHYVPATDEDEKAPLDGGTSQEGTADDASTTSKPDDTRPTQGRQDDIPGQMHILDYPDALPELDWMEATSHGTDT